MGELFQTIAVEGLYRQTREKFAASGVLLSREDFIQMRWRVDVDVDGFRLLAAWDAKIAIVAVAVPAKPTIASVGGNGKAGRFIGR